MRANTRHSSFLVRSYYRAWLLNPYFCKGKLGGVFALSQQGKALVGEIPCITNDDEYVRRKVPESQTCFIEDCEFEVIAPISISSLINVRTRVMRGNQELRAAGLNVKERQVETSWMLKQIVSNPSSIPDLIVYSAVNLWVKSKLLFQFGDHPRWERDESSRDHMATEVYQ
jgi:hypothetical protein